MPKRDEVPATQTGAPVEAPPGAGEVGSEVPRQGRDEGVPRAVRHDPEDDAPIAQYGEDPGA